MWWSSSEGMECTDKKHINRRLFLLSLVTVTMCTDEKFRNYR
jgi:hypothetical protein